MHACNVARSYELSYMSVDTVSINHKKYYIKLDLFLMLIQSTQSNYNVDSNTKYLNYMKPGINGSNYNRVQINSLN